MNEGVLGKVAAACGTEIVEVRCVAGAAATDAAFPAVAVCESAVDPDDNAEFGTLDPTESKGGEFPSSDPPPPPAPELPEGEPEEPEGSEPPPP